MNKLLGILLAGVFATTLLAGCGEKAKEAADAAKSSMGDAVNSAKDAAAASADTAKDAAAATADSAKAAVQMLQKQLKKLLLKQKIKQWMQYKPQKMQLLPIPPKNKY